MRVTTTTARFRLYLLGAFRLERDARVLILPTRKAESLLAYLALFRAPQPREKLAALFWGDSPSEQALHSLRTALTRLRRQLGSEALLSDRQTVQLNPDFDLAVDVSEFEQATDVHTQVELYRGDLLPDFYEEWIPRERERLRALYLDALLRIAQNHREEGKYAQAIEAARRVLDNDPANEGAHQHLIFCLAASGDRVAALKQYDKCREALHEELDVEPSSETTALRDRIVKEIGGSPSGKAALTNLPSPLTSFVGRKPEQLELEKLLKKARLLTLTGVGGGGKTRLAIEIARAVLPDFAEGVWWVELAALSDTTHLPRAVAQVLGLQESRERTLAELVASFIRSKSMLLVLDNCEHLIAACAELSEKLLLACPNLKLIATSREGLNVTGETLWRVPSLAVPDAQYLPSMDKLVQYDAIQLFLQRASAVGSTWSMGDDGLAVAEICVRLDGLPLAIELAAARVKGLSVQQIAARLNDRFHLLTGGSRTASPRQRTLQATLDWSYRLLSEPERVMLQRLAAFAGGWTLEQAEYVCAGGAIPAEDTLDLLAELVDKSLVRAETRTGAERYHMLETIRQYARDRLLESGEAEHVCLRHLDYFVRSIEAQAAGGDHQDAARSFERLEREHDNLRAALAWSLDQPGEIAERGASLAEMLAPFWFDRAFLQDGRQWLEKALMKLPAAGPRRAHTLRHLGRFAWQQGDIPPARAWLEESVQLFRALAPLDPSGLAQSTHFLGHILADQRDYVGARALFEESLKLFEGLEDKSGQRTLIGDLGFVAYHSGHYAIARRYLESSLALIREEGDQRGEDVFLRLGDLERLAGHDDRAQALYLETLDRARAADSKLYIASPLHKLGYVARHRRRLNRAESFFQESLRLQRDAGNRQGIAECLLGLGGVAVDKGDPSRAVRLFAAAENLVSQIEVPLAPADVAERERDILRLREQLDEASFSNAWETGRKMTLERVMTFVLQPPRPRGPIASNRATQSMTASQ